MKYLGLDLGTRTLGLAISDQTKTIANSYETIHFKDSDYDCLYEPLKKIIEDEQIEKIILGLPKNMNNTIGDRANVTMKFGNELSEKLNIKVVLQDERLSTIEATNYLINADMSRKKRKKKVDSIAASIILQTYLDKEKGTKV